MNLFFQIILVVLLTLASVVGVDAQNVDHRLRVGVVLKQKVGDKLYFSLEQQSRLKDDVNTYDRHLSEFGVAYRFFDGYKAGLVHRLAFLDDEVRNRIDVNNVFDVLKGDLDITYRFKAQFNFPYYQGVNTTFRNKIKFDYNLGKKIDPFFQYELFYNKNFRFNDWNNHRFGTGLDYSISKRRTLTLFYYYEEEFNLESPEINGIFGVKYSHRFKKIKLKAKNNSSSDK